MLQCLLVGRTACLLDSLGVCALRLDCELFLKMEQINDTLMMPRQINTRAL